MRGQGRILKTFIWLAGVGFLVTMFVSLHELVMKQTVKLQVLSSQRSTFEDIGNAARPIEVQSNLTHDAVPPPNIELAQPLVPPPPTTHVGFLKVHKAASTTTQAIFLRFGWRRNLTFILPPEYNKFGYPNIISINESLTIYNTLPPPEGKQIDILCHHVVFGEAEWDAFLPPDSKYVGTVREPFRLFVSTLNYFNPRTVANAARVDAADPVGAFLKSPSKFEQKDTRYSFTNNRLAFEYGVSPKIIQDRDFAAFDKYLHEVLDKRFSVVILAERFDESLVMLKRKLNWELNDILYAIKNVRSVAKEDRYKTKDEHKPLHREAAIFDYLLYEFFEKRMNKQIEEEGESFVKEVINFQQVRKYIEDFCHRTNKNVGSVLIQDSEWSDAFEISRSDCDIMHKGEIQFTQMIRKHQYGSATWTGPGQKQVPIINNKPKQAQPH